MGPDGLHLRVLRELAGVIAELLSAIYQHSWLSGEVPEDRRLASVTPIYKESHKENHGNLKACQPDLSARKGYGADRLE